MGTYYTYSIYFRESKVPLLRRVLEGYSATDTYAFTIVFKDFILDPQARKVLESIGGGFSFNRRSERISATFTTSLFQQDRMDEILETISDLESAIDHFEFEYLFLRDAPRYFYDPVEIHDKSITFWGKGHVFSEWLDPGIYKGADALMDMFPDCYCCTLFADEADSLELYLGPMDNPDPENRFSRYDKKKRRLNISIQGIHMETGLIETLFDDLKEARDSDLVKTVTVSASKWGLVYENKWSEYGEILGSALETIKDPSRMREISSSVSENPELSKKIADMLLEKAGQLSLDAFGEALHYDFVFRHGDPKAKGKAKQALRSAWEEIFRQRSEESEDIIFSWRYGRRFSELFDGDELKALAESLEGEPRFRFTMAYLKPKGTALEKLILAHPDTVFRFDMLYGIGHDLLSGLIEREPGRFDKDVLRYLLFDGKFGSPPWVRLHLMAMFAKTPDDFLRIFGIMKGTKRDDKERYGKVMDTLRKRAPEELRDVFSFLDGGCELAPMLVPLHGTMLGEKGRDIAERLCEESLEGVDWEEILDEYPAYCLSEEKISGYVEKTDYPGIAALFSGYARSGNRSKARHVVEELCKYEDGFESMMAEDTLSVKDKEYAYHILSDVERQERVEGYLSFVLDNLEDLDFRRYAFEIKDYAHDSKTWGKIRKKAAHLLKEGGRKRWLSHFTSKPDTSQ